MAGRQRAEEVVGAEVEHGQQPAQPGKGIPEDAEPGDRHGLRAPVESVLDPFHPVGRRDGVGVEPGDDAADGRVVAGGCGSRDADGGLDDDSRPVRPRDRC